MKLLLWPGQVSAADIVSATSFEGKAVLSTVAGYLVGAVLHVGFMSFAGLAVLAVYDHWLARRIAKITGSEDLIRAQMGKVNKGTGLFLVFFFLAVEAWIGLHPGWINTHGIIGSGLACWLGIEDIKSIVRHKKRAGGRVPMWLEELLDLTQIQVDERVAKVLNPGRFTNGSR